MVAKAKKDFWELELGASFKSNTLPSSTTTIIIIIIKLHFT